MTTVNREAAIPVEEAIGELAAQRRFRSYPEYRDSGVEWLERVPCGWATKRLRFVARINPVKSELHGVAPDAEVSFVPMEAVCEYGGLALEQTKPLESVQQGYTYFRDGDIVVAKITPCFENGKGSIATGLTNGVGFGTTELHVLRPQDELDTSFLFYLTITHGFRGLGAAEMYGAGGQKRVPDDFLRDFRTPIPSPPEQQAIAAFLDRETARIDALIARKQRLIELLAEKRTALISHAVTKGLNPDAPMKDSGVEWLGEVPANWAVLPAKRVSSVFVPERNKPDLNDAGEGFPWITPEDIGGKDVPTPSTSRWVSRAAATINRSRPLVQGSVLACCVGSFGVASVNTEACIINQQIQAYIPRHVDSYFLRYVVSVAGAYFETVATATTLRYINQESFGELPIALPSSTQQRDIVLYLDAATEAIECLVARITGAVAMLREYRSALISAAVTGKIDVRHMPGLDEDELIAGCAVASSNSLTIRGRCDEDRL